MRCASTSSLELRREPSVRSTKRSALRLKEKSSLARFASVGFAGLNREQTRPFLTVEGLPHSASPVRPVCSGFFRLVFRCLLAQLGEPFHESRQFSFVSGALESSNKMVERNCLIAVVSQRLPTFIYSLVVLAPLQIKLGQRIVRVDSAGLNAERSSR